MDNTDRNYPLIALVVGIAIALVLVWIGANRRADEGRVATGEAVQVTVGWMGPLTGDAASYGESIKRGVELAQEDLDAHNINLVFEDSKCQPKEAVSVINQLINTRQVPAIIGEVCSGATLAAAPVAQQNQVVMISTASTSPKLTDAGEYIFRTVPSDAAQGSFGAQLVSDDGNTRLAILYSNEEYGVGLNEVLTNTFSGQVVASEAFERGTADLRSQLTKIRSANPDAVYIVSNSPDSAVAALQQIEELGIQADLYGSEGLKNTDIIEGAGDAAEDLKITAVSSGSDEFTQRHEEMYGEEPGPFAAQGYDAFTAIHKAVSQGASTGPEIRDVLISLQFQGASGMIRFDQNGDISGNFDVLHVENGAFVPVNS